MTDFDPDLDLAYQFAPSQRPHDPGHPRLVIHLRATPTGHHFDPEQALIPVFAYGGSSDLLKITHPWTGQDALRVFPGRVILRDRIGKTAEAFTFGGEVQVSSDESRTTCDITSSAPILNITGDRSLAEIMAEEVEILLAGQYAAWAHDPDHLDRKLATLRPRDFYAACLASLKEKLKSYPLAENSSMEKLARLIRSETLAWPAGSISAGSPRTLAEVISSP
jgi:hypothetical protein